MVLVCAFSYLMPARSPSFRTFSRSYSASTLLDPYLSLLRILSIDQPCISITKKVHAKIHSLGLAQDSSFATKLISSYSLCHLPDRCRNVFDSVQHKNIFLYNQIIDAYAKNRIFEDPFLLFNQMCSCEDASPDNFTLATLLKVCREIGDLIVGAMVHCRSLKMGFLSDIVLGNSLMAMYNKYGNFGDVRKMFDEMPDRNSSSWNVLIPGLAVTGNNEFNADVWNLVKQMQVEGVRLDAFTVSSLLPLCGYNTGKRDHGREIHCIIIKSNMNVDSDVHVGSCLIDMYSKMKKVIVGRRVFDRMNCRNVVAWTSMISAYVENGSSEEAFMIFQEMQLRDGIEPNRITLISILPACNSLGVLMEGKQIHGFSIRKECNNDLSLCNALINMYSKCGHLNYARRVFDSGGYCKDTISWSSMISGYRLNGKGDEAVSLYSEMIQLGIKPDNITLVGVLSGCAKSGMVTEGLSIYNSAINSHNVSPTVELCACIVDMLGRSGQVSKALEFVKTMPVKPGPSVWGSLFGASVAHGNSDMQDLAYKSLIQVEPENPSNYISLSNVYASLKRWDVVADLRKKMRGRGLKKVPGRSWISISNETHSFCVADKTHPCSALIYELLDDLKVIMKGTGNTPDSETLM